MTQSRWHSAEQEGNWLTAVCPQLVPRGQVLTLAGPMRTGPDLPILYHYFLYLKAGIANWRPSGHTGPTTQFYAHMVPSFPNFLKNGIICQHFKMRRVHTEIQISLENPGPTFQDLGAILGWVTDVHGLWLHHSLPHHCSSLIPHLLDSRRSLPGPCAHLVSSA